jgi:hypothetical protein
MPFGNHLSLKKRWQFGYVLLLNKRCHLAITYSEKAMAIWLCLIAKYTLAIWQHAITKCTLAIFAITYR